jgi:hypothetical protein
MIAPLVLRKDTTVYVAASYQTRVINRSQIERTRAGALLASLPVAGLFVETQYEIPFKLSISTFHVSVMATTPTIASHKVRHPSW